MDLYSSWQKLKTYSLENQNIFLRVPFCFALQLAIFFDKRVNDSEEDKKSTYELAAIASGVVGITGLMMNLAYLQNFYFWLFEQVVLLMAFLAIAMYGPVEAESEISSARASSSYLSGILGYTLLYTQVFVAVTIAIVPRKWTAVSAKQTIAAFIIFPLVLQLLTFPFSKVSLILRDLCLAYLVLASAIQLLKGFVGILQLLHSMPGVMKNSCSLVYSFGWMEFFSYHWRRTSLARVLMIAWLVKFTAKVILYLRAGLSNTLAGSLVECFDSILDLAGASVLVGVTGRMTLDFVKTFLQQNQEPPAEDRQQETWTGISFFLLGMQAGIINHQKHQERLLLISLVLFVTLSFFLQSAYELTEPALMSLGATYTGIISGKHLRTLAVCIVILILPGFMIAFLCQMFSFDAWLFVIISSNLVTIVQVMGSLTTYSLFVSNVHSETQVKDLDDHIYYINAGSKVFEFLVAVVILPYTAWATLNGHWNYLGAAVISLHAYFNVYKRAQEGWKNFLLRRSAVKRLNSLQWATEEQLRNLDDVCCICYEVLDKAKVTKCNHYFHSLCLRKWLYVQDMCPMCHADILPQD